jgi:hypothetical protein
VVAGATTASAGARAGDGSGVVDGTGDGGCLRTPGGRCSGCCGSSGALRSRVPRGVGGLRSRPRALDGWGSATAGRASSRLAIPPGGPLARPTSAGRGGGSGGSSKPGPTTTRPPAAAAPAASLPTLRHRMRLRSMPRLQARARARRPCPRSGCRYSHPPPMRSSRQAGPRADGCKSSPAIVLSRARASGTRRSLRPRRARLSLASPRPRASR